MLNAGQHSAVGDLHADRRGELHDGDGDRLDHRGARRRRSITWATPADIIYGTALSATQLNATTTVSRARFVYTPAAGAVLNAGDAQRCR